MIYPAIVRYAPYLRYTNRIVGRGTELLLDKENATGHACNSTTLQTVNTKFMLMQLPNTLLFDFSAMQFPQHSQRGTRKIKNVALWSQ
jgi:hypothetical protein